MNLIHFDCCVMVYKTVIKRCPESLWKMFQPRYSISRYNKRNRPFCYFERNQNRTVSGYILKDIRMCTIVLEALTPLNRTSHIKVYENNARSTLFCRIAKRSITEISIFPRFHILVHHMMLYTHAKFQGSRLSRTEIN